MPPAPELMQGAVATAARMRNMHPHLFPKKTLKSKARDTYLKIAVLHRLKMAARPKVDLPIAAHRRKALKVLSAGSAQLHIQRHFALYLLHRLLYMTH